MDLVKINTLSHLLEVPAIRENLEISNIILELIKSELDKKDN